MTDRQKEFVLLFVLASIGGYAVMRQLVKAAAFVAFGWITFRRRRRSIHETNIAQGLLADPHAVKPAARP